MREVDESLELMKKDHKRRMDICEQRRIRFEEKQAKMREQVLKFEKFIQENDAKRIRAELKAKQERKSYEEKVREIASLNDEIKRLELDQKRLDSELSTSSPPPGVILRLIVTPRLCRKEERLPPVSGRHRRERRLWLR